MKYLIIFILFICLNSYAEDDHHNHHNHHDEEGSNKENEQKSLKAHQHGVSILNIAQEGNNLVFEFEMP